MSQFPPPPQNQGFPPSPDQGFPQQGFGGMQQNAGGYPPSPFAPYPPPPPPRRGPNVLLILGGVVIICVLLCCGCSAVVASTPEFIIGFWTGMAGSGGASDTTTTFGIVCDGSQAEDYSLDFDTRYPSTTAMSVNMVKADSTGVSQAEFRSGQSLDSDKVYDVTGTVTSLNGTEDYNAYFVMGDDPAFFGIFGSCIEGIYEYSE